MKRPRSHEIDELAMRVFRSALPPSWIVNEQFIDYAKDYNVEIVDETNVTGLEFIVQLKGEECSSISKDGRHATFWLQKKHAVYYADKVKRPVFLVLVDVNKNIGRWIFIQEYLIDGKRWRAKNSVAIRVPTQNMLADTSALRKAVEAAHDYMAALNPVAIKTAIQAQQVRWESLDPRFCIRIDVVDDQERISVIPKEPVNIRFLFKGPPESLNPKLDNLLGRGLPTSFGPDDLDVTGSPLFAEAFKSGGILEFSHPIEGTVALIAQDGSGRVLSRLDSIPGWLTGGHKECRFEGELPAAPLKLHITSHREGGSGPLVLGFDMRRWHGHPVLLLPYFDQIAAFFDGVKACAAIDVKCFVQGNELFTGRMQDLSIFKGLADFVPLVSKAREISRLAGISPILNEKIDREKAQDIQHLHGLITKGEYRYKVPGAKLSVPCDRTIIQPLLKSPPVQDAPLLFITVESQKGTLFGEEVDVGRLEHEYTHVQLAMTKKELRERLTRTRAKSVKVEFVCTDTSEHIVRRHLT